MRRAPREFAYFVRVAEGSNAEARSCLYAALDRGYVTEAAFDELADLARGAGLPILDLTAAYGGVADLDTLRVATWDDHPNADGHRRLAEEWHRQMQASPAWRTALGLEQTTPVAPAPAGSGAVTRTSTGN